MVHSGSSTEASCSLVSSRAVFPWEQTSDLDCVLRTHLGRIFFFSNCRDLVQHQIFLLEFLKWKCPLLKGVNSVPSLLSSLPFLGFSSLLCRWAPPTSPSWLQPQKASPPSSTDHSVVSDGNKLTQVPRLQGHPDEFWSLEFWSRLLLTPSKPLLHSMVLSPADGKTQGQVSPGAVPAGARASLHQAPRDQLPGGEAVR